MLTLKITNQTLELGKHSDRVVADSVQYLKARFYFSSDWIGFNKYALFYLPEWANPKQVTIVDNVCEVPAEVLVAPGFDVSVYGSKGDTQIVTTEKVRVEVRPSGLKEGSPPLPPPENLYETVQNAVDEVKTAKSDVKTAVDQAKSDLSKNAESAIANIKAVESAAMKSIASAGFTDSDTTFKDDGSIVETTTAYTATTTFEDGKVIEKFDYVNGTSKKRITSFDESGIHVKVEV